jgi:tyramine---L-glutamate ligase
VRLFVFEFVTGGGMAGEPLPAGLTREADLMVRSLIEELASVPGVELLATRDPRLPPLDGVTVVPPEPGESPFDLYARVLSRVDAAWPTAPETGGVLERLARLTVAHRRQLVGSEADAIELTASKRRTASHLRAAGIPTVPTYLRGDPLPPLDGPWIVKPDDGAGSDGTTRLSDWRQAARLMERLASPAVMVAQPWIEGPPVSLSLLVASGRAVILSGNRQRIQLTADRVSLAGLEVNAIDTGPFEGLAQAIAAAVPGLWGYVGVDLIDGVDGPVVLEINPRLTTSYCGLGRALDINVAGLVIDLLRTGVLPRSMPVEKGTPVILLLGGEHDG